MLAIRVSWTFLLYTDCLGNKKIIIMSTQSAQQSLQDMMRQYCEDEVYPDMKKLREVLTQLSDQQKLHILQQRYSGGTPLVCAASRDDTEIISTLLKSLQPSADTLKLLMIDE